MSMTVAAERADCWQSALATIRCEWDGLAAQERAWVVAAVEEIAGLQGRLQQLVDAVDGAAACRDCAGGCCGHGTYHLTLVNVLASLARGVALPEPDFSRSCPWLGEKGCRFPPALRPFNCITFNCDIIDDRLPSAEVVQIEARLRKLYTSFDKRYYGSSLRGLLNRPSGFSGRYLARRSS